MKNILLLITIMLLVSCAKKDEVNVDIRKTVSNAYPDVAIDEIKKIDDNFHEIIINKQIYYATNDGKYLIVGNVINLNTKESITENTKMNQRLSIIDSIDMKNYMIFKPKKTDHILTIFTDTSCPYCQKLHNEIPDLLENNIEIRYVLFSRNGNDVDAYQQLVSAWCSADKVDALEDLFAGDILDDISNCENPIARNFDYAGSLSVEGTPTIFLEDGRIIPGYQSYENILAFINK
ncbi:DsbC family protein [Gammaproteobacteria bacterium]|nr:DsbC family protein [Gammaproteobacteria bacterium]